LYKFNLKKIVCILVLPYLCLIQAISSETNLSQKKETIFSNKSLEFLPLPETQEIRKNNNLGKIDPFIKNGSKENTLFGNIKLLGVYSSNQEIFAFVKFNGETGELRKGDIGGTNTNLLPKQVLLKTIKINPTYIIMEFRKREYKLSL